jgi:arylsulfatase A-like enzyme
VEQANQWLRSLHQDQPFYLWLHLFEPHGPYEISDYARQRMQDYGGILKNGADMQLLLGKSKQILESEQNLEALQHLYAGEVNRADKLVGELIEALASEGVLQNTIVILTSDHGQGLGENGTMGHGAILWESVIRVPLIITDFRTPAGKTVQERVGTIDIAPTIADFAGLDKAFDQHGQSLRNAASGELEPDQIYFAEVELRTGASAEESWYYADSLAVYSGNLKQISKRDKLELFETRAADNHLTPIAPDQISALAEYLAGLNEEFLAAESRFKSARVSEADRDQLQGLGYTQ